MFCAWLCAAAFRISWIAFASRWPEEKPANICAALFGESRVRSFTRTSISPQVGSTRNIVLGLPQKGPAGVFFATMAAPETCASLTASANPATGTPFPSVVPTHDSMRQLLQKLFQVCQTRDRRPSSMHSSKNEKSDDEAKVLTAVKPMKWLDWESKSCSSANKMSASAMMIYAN